MKYRILTLLALFPLWLCAQGTQFTTYRLAQPDSVYGVTSSVSEKGMSKLLVERLDKPVANQIVKGHRVCVFMEKNQSARAGAFEAEATFKQHYPDIPTYVVYDRTSYWKVLVGNCLTVDEVTMMKAKAEKLFPSKPFIVQEDIPITEFGKSGKDIASSQYLASAKQREAAAAEQSQENEGAEETTPGTETPAVQPTTNNTAPKTTEWVF